MTRILKGVMALAIFIVVPHFLAQEASGVTSSGLGITEWPRGGWEGMCTIIGGNIVLQCFMPI